jgi:hypothetical protein
MSVGRDSQIEMTPEFEMLLCLVRSAAAVNWPDPQLCYQLWFLLKAAIFQRLLSNFSKAS